MHLKPPAPVKAPPKQTSKQRQPTLPAQRRWSRKNAWKEFTFQAAPGRDVMSEKQGGNEDGDHQTQTRKS